MEIQITADRNTNYSKDPIHFLSGVAQLGARKKTILWRDLSFVFKILWSFFFCQLYDKKHINRHITVGGMNVSVL